PVQERDKVSLIFQHVNLVYNQDHLLLGGNPLQRCAVLGAEAQHLDHEQRDIGVARRFGRPSVQGAMKYAARARLLPGCVHEDVLTVLARQDAGDQMPRGLRFGRDDRELFADQAVEQARFPGIRATGDAYRATAPHFHFESCSSIALAACCSARWREVPLPVAVRPSSPTAHSTSKDWRCAAPCTDSTRYSGSRRRFACSISCSWVFGSLPGCSGSSRSTRGPNAFSTVARAA